MCQTTGSRRYSQHVRYYRHLGLHYQLYTIQIQATHYPEPCTSLVLRLTSISSNKEHKCFDSVNIQLGLLFRLRLYQYLSTGSRLLPCLKGGLIIFDNNNFLLSIVNSPTPSKKKSKAG